MKFTKEQAEGFARVTDGLAIASIIGAVVGITGHSPLQPIEIGALIAVTPLLLWFGYSLRKPK
jgi:hypothetical protein